MTKAEQKRLEEHAAELEKRTAQQFDRIQNLERDLSDEKALSRRLRVRNEELAKYAIGWCRCVGNVQQSGLYILEGDFHLSDVSAHNQEAGKPWHSKATHYFGPIPERKE